MGPRVIDELSSLIFNAHNLVPSGYVKLVASAVTILLVLSVLSQMLKILSSAPAKALLPHSIRVVLASLLTVALTIQILSSVLLAVLN
jgi:DNA integrity scanning protein DisA with diadenylate cyclase activity